MIIQEQPCSLNWLKSHLFMFVFYGLISYKGWLLELFRLKATILIVLDDNS